MARGNHRPPLTTDAILDRVSLAIIGFVALLVLFTFRDYGITWDESYHLSYGSHILRFFGTGFRDTTAVTYRIDYLYGGGFDALGMIFRSACRPFLSRYDAIHLFGALIGVLGIAGTWKLARELGGARCGLVAVAMMATTSVYYGHMFNNPKDLPFAAGHAWGLYYLFRLVRAFPKIPRGLAIKAAIAIGLAMSVRIGGLLLVCYLALAVGWWCVRHALRTRSAEATYQTLRQLAPRLGLVVGGSWLVMLVWWPWALHDPIRRPLAALSRMSQFIDHRRYMPFAGEEVYNLDPPWDYLLHYFGLKLPEYLVVGALLATVIGLGLLLSSDRKKLHPKRQLVLWILGISVWFPPIWAAYKGSPLYDGLRHFLFLIPPIVAGVALLIDYAMTAAGRRWGRPGVVGGAAVVIALVADQAAMMMMLHPHQYVYFNRFGGGLAGVVGRYDTDYYAETFKDSAETLVSELWKREPEVYLQTVYRVSGCIGEFRSMNYMPANFYWKTPGKRPDFHIGYTRAGCAEKHPKNPIYSRVERVGGLLNVARDMRVVMVPREELLELRATAKRVASKQKPKSPKKKKKSTPRKKRPKVDAAKPVRPANPNSGTPRTSSQP